MKKNFIAISTLVLFGCTTPKDKTIKHTNKIDLNHTEADERANPENFIDYIVSFKVTKEDGIKTTAKFKTHTKFVTYQDIIAEVRYFDSDGKLYGKQNDSLWVFIPPGETATMNIKGDSSIYRLSDYIEFEILSVGQR